MVQFRIIRMWLGLSRRQIVIGNPLSVVVHNIPLWVFLWKIGNGLTVGMPKRLPGSVGDLAAVLSVDIHYIHTANRPSPLALIDDETQFRSVG